MDASTMEHCLYVVKGAPLLCMTRGEWAAWVQAIGSIAAILAGFMFVQRAHSLTSTSERRQRTRHRAQEIDLLAAKLNAHREQLELCLRSWENGEQVEASDILRANMLHALVRDAHAPTYLPVELHVEWLLAHAASGEAFTAANAVYGAAVAGSEPLNRFDFAEIGDRLSVMRRAADKLVASRDAVATDRSE